MITTVDSGCFHSAENDEQIPHHPVERQKTTYTPSQKTHYNQMVWYFYGRNESHWQKKWEGEGGR